jgi:AraC-like DNA-binding protein
MSTPLAQALLRFTGKQPGESPFRTPIDSVLVMRSERQKPPSHLIYQPAMCIVAQGAKWATFGGDRYEYGAGEALVVGIETPSVGGVAEASPDKPCLVLAFGLDLAIMRSVADGLDPPPAISEDISRGVLVTDFAGPLEDCALRMVRLFDLPAAIPTLYPVIMREICYWLLTGPHGREIARIALTSSPSQRVIDALQALRRRYMEPVRIEELAAVARLSPSAFHRQFKALTSQTPLQYQKQLRLLEARRLMIASAVNVESAAFAVGYQSPSQFSREYARMFGEAPKREIARVGAVPLEGPAW